MFEFIDTTTSKTIKLDLDIEIIEEIYYQKIKPKKVTEEFKKKASEIDDKIPLYDTFSENLYLISRHNIYNRVMKNHYRFPNSKLIELIKNKKIDDNDPLKDTIVKKRDLILEFMKIYNLEVLKDTYVKVFYEFSSEVGKNLTNCLRPSFSRYFKHINPYYTRSEIINTALNMGLIQSSKIYYDDKKIDELCPKVVENDIDKDTILAHHKYILNNKKMGIVQYYSLQGSFFMNQYLRELTNYKSKNEYLEKLIKTMKDIVADAPAFDKSYTVYRFVENDNYLEHLEEGDIFVDKGFTSTTRDPFYNSDEIKFGFVLMKIKIPGRKKGVGLCMETVSHFPKEQEIILPPGTKFKLVAKNTNCDFYHTSYSFSTKVSKKYEFEIVGKEEITIDRKKTFEPQIVDFLKLEEVKSGLDERLYTFSKIYCGEQFRFKTNIGNKLYDVMIERYDSTSVYSDFYYKKTENGVSIYSIDQDYVSFSLELTDEFLYVNYYFHHSLTDRDSISNDDLLKFVASVAKYFGIRHVIIFTDYQISEYGFGLGNHNVDFYEYLKYGKERFEKEGYLVKAKFTYYALDIMKNMDLSKVLKKSDNDELYQVRKKLYTGPDNLKDFYLWIVENYSYLVDTLIDKTPRVFKEYNPFEYDFYIMDPSSYLFNKKYLPFHLFMSSFNYDVKIQPKNVYRLTDDINQYRNRRL